MDINDRVKAVRKELKLTQSSFSGPIGLSQSRLAAVEAHRGSVTDRTIKLICTEYGVSEGWLRTGDGPMFTPHDDVDTLVAAFDFPGIVAQLLKAYEGLSPDQQAAVLTYARRVIAGITRTATIEDKVAAYRQELLAQEDAATSQASPTTADGAQKSKRA